LALIFWDNKYLRYLFLILTVFFGASVLLAHVHYPLMYSRAVHRVRMYVITPSFSARLRIICL